jgi:hypothetical protein
MFKKLMGVSASSTTSRSAAGADWWQWPALAQTGVLHVVGESNYQDALAASVDDHGRAVIAQLVAEPSNKYDRRAIRVDVGGRTVGYVPKDTTDVWHPVLASMKGQPVTARAIINGGGSGYFFGIVVLASTSSMDRRRGFLYGNKQVVMQVPKADAAAVASQVPEGTGRAATLGVEGDLVVVDVDGVRVGKMTKQSSANYAPLVAAAAASGLGAGCWLTMSVKSDGTPKFSLNLVDELDAWEAAVARANFKVRQEPVVVEAVAASTAPADWHADPTGRHQLRYWDGSAWTAHVADDGVTSSDPV